jgi:hypothetical protein
MIHEFAVEPEVMATWEHFRVVWKDIGVGEGRFLVEFPGNWRKRVYELVDTLSKPVHAYSIKSKLGDTVLRRAKFVGASGRGFDGGDWLANAIRQQAGEKPFRAIVVRTNPASRSDVLTSGEFDLDSEPWHVAREKHLHRNTNELVGAARALLRHCRELVLVDPHFDPWEPRYVGPFTAFVGVRSDWQRLEIHRVLPDPFLRNLQEANYRRLQESVPERITLSVLFWPRLLDKDTIHARYILTERGGIGYDWGLDEGQNAAQATVVRLVEHESYLRLSEQYHRDARIFGIPERLELKGSLQRP